MSLNTVFFTVDLRFQFIAILCKVVIHVSGDLEVLVRYKSYASIRADIVLCNQYKQIAVWCNVQTQLYN